MSFDLEDYLPIVGDGVVASIHRKARRLYGRHVVHINSTYLGGGVAEILNSLVPLTNDVGIMCGWRTLHGDPDFFMITKKFHHALQGERIHLTEMKKKIYEKTGYRFANFTHIQHDCVIVHDPQPLPLVRFYRKTQPWIWRCHIDISDPNPAVWSYLKYFILRYDVLVVSMDQYVHQDLPVEQRVIPPAIDPLSPKNVDLSPQEIAKYLKKYDIPTDKPLLVQISRFDRWKDPMGVVEVFKRVRDEVDCRLVLCGSMAMDDPEGIAVFQRLVRRYRSLLDRREVIVLTLENSILVNVLQRMAAVVLQKSLREGFGLSVTEALWKGRPVVASRTGGIVLQIEDGVSGFLVDPEDVDGFAKRVVEILRDPERGRDLGEQGRERVRERFLVTRLLSDYLDLFTELLA